MLKGRFIITKSYNRNRPIQLRREAKFFVGILRSLFIGVKLFLKKVKDNNN